VHCALTPQLLLHDPQFKGSEETGVSQLKSLPIHSSNPDSQTQGAHFPFPELEHQAGRGHQKLLNWAEKETIPGSTEYGKNPSKLLFEMILRENNGNECQLFVVWCHDKGLTAQ